MLLGAALLACAIGVAPTTMDAIVSVESAGNVLAIHVNKWHGEQPRARDKTDGAAIVRHFATMGYSVDIGLVQLNSRNLEPLGLSVEDAFDGCKNLEAGARVLSGFYGQAVMQFGKGQHALMAALSGYNTGTLWKGFANGYVQRYYIDAALPKPTAKQQVIAIKHTFSTVVYNRPGFETHMLQ